MAFPFRLLLDAFFPFLLYTFLTSHIRDGGPSSRLLKLGSCFSGLQCCGSKGKATRQVYLCLSWVKWCLCGNNACDHWTKTLWFFSICWSILILQVYRAQRNHPLSKSGCALLCISCRLVHFPMQCVFSWHPGNTGLLSHLHQDTYFRKRLLQSSNSAALEAQNDLRLPFHFSVSHCA